MAATLLGTSIPNDGSNTTPVVVACALLVPDPVPQLLAAA